MFCESLNFLTSLMLLGLCVVTKGIISFYSVLRFGFLNSCNGILYAFSIPILITCNGYFLFKRDVLSSVYLRFIVSWSDIIVQILLARLNETLFLICRGWHDRQSKYCFVSVSLWLISVVI